MILKKIQDADLVDKRVLLRVGFNVALENGRIKESFRIESAKETVNFLLGKKAKVALVSHLGRPNGLVNLEFSLEQLKRDAERILGKEIEFVPNCIGEEVKKGLDNLKSGKILLLENVRFHTGERLNDKNFAKALSKNFEIYVNDAFSVCHRNHASVTGITEFLPSYAGLWMQKEIENLNKVKNNPDHPATAIIGGAKIETKLPVIENFIRNYDHILVGGKVACEVIDKKMKFDEKVVLAQDFSANRYDIGPETIKKFKEIVLRSKTVVWNGPLGKFENPSYSKGTIEVLNAVIESRAFSLVGGGESVQVLEENNMMSKISFVSTGGGALLEYLGGGPMPGLDALSELSSDN